MKEDRLQKRVSQLLMILVKRVLIVMFMLLTGLMALASADDSITISCYKDARSGWSLGSVVVFDVAEAAQACNTVYYDCRGRCIGCFHDFDYVDNVCIDMQGNKFLR